MIVFLSRVATVHNKAIWKTGREPPREFRADFSHPITNGRQVCFLSRRVEANARVYTYTYIYTRHLCGKCNGSKRRIAARVCATKKGRRVRVCAGNKCAASRVRDQNGLLKTCGVAGVFCEVCTFVFFKLLFMLLQRFFSPWI